MSIPRVPAALFILIWAFGYPLGALGISAMSPMALLTIRFAGSAAVMTGLAVATRRTFPRGRLLAHAAVVGFLTQFLQFGCAYLGLALGVPAAITALVIAINPVATALLAWPALGQRISPRQWLAVALGTCAVLSACLPRVLTHLATMGPAIALTVVALLGVALGGIYQQRFCPDMDAVAGNAIGLIVAAIPTAAIAFTTTQEISDPWRAAWVLPIMIVVSSIVGTTLFLRLVRTAGAAATSMLFTLIPAVAAVVSWVLLGQRLDLGIGVGLAFGALSLVVAQRRTHRGEKPLDATPTPEVKVEPRRPAVNPRSVDHCP